MDGADVPADHVMQFGTDDFLQHLHGVGQLVAGKTLGHVVQAPPEVVAAGPVVQLIGRPNVPDCICRRSQRRDEAVSSVFVQQDHSRLPIVDIRGEHEAEIDAVAVRKQHQVDKMPVPYGVAHDLGHLHDQRFAEPACHPVRIVVERLDVMDEIRDVIVLIAVCRYTWIGARTRQQHGADPLVGSGYA